MRADESLNFRRGEEQDEPSDGKGKGKRPVKEKKEKPLWQQTASKKKEIKIKTEYKTYEEIVADQGGEPEGVGILVDLSGNAVSTTLIGEDQTDES